MSDKPPYFVDDRHALYAGSIIGIAMREGVVAYPLVDELGNYTDRIWIASLGVALVVPEPPANWMLGAQRCVCGAVELAGGSVELAGVKHRLDGPCFACDDYGEAL